MSTAPPILVVDDDESIREMIAIVLGARGYAVAEAGNGAEALERAHAEPPALILLDLMMPGMDGVTLVNELRRDPALARTPVVVLSGDTAACERTANLRINRCLVKPIELTELIEIAERYTLR